MQQTQTHFHTSVFFIFPCTYYYYYWICGYFNCIYTFSYYKYYVEVIMSLRICISIIIICLISYIFCNSDSQIIRYTSIGGQVSKLITFKLKLSPKCNLGFFCGCMWFKPSCKSIITMKEALLRFTLFSFLGQIHFKWEYLECFGDLVF